MQKSNTPGTANEVIRRIEERFTLEPSNSVEFIYDHTESQSGKRLAVIYLPFDPLQRGHFIDRAQILDYALHIGTGKVLDFGPGDGWPSLLMAPMVEEVVGVDGSKRRVDVCTANAERLGIDNASFVHVPPGEPLPFADDSFDAVTAASSIEGTPDPKATLKELFRVLKPGGRLRMHYESLGFYRGSREQELWGLSIDPDRARLVIYDRRIDEGVARNIGLAMDLSADEVRAVFDRHGQSVELAGLSSEVLEELAPHVVKAVEFTTRHPTAKVWLDWMREIGFRKAKPTYDGGWFAGRLFDRLDKSDIPKTMAEVDAYLKPLVEVVIGMDAPQTVPDGQWEHWITVEK
jgi:SAM-dependent methyltransferase